LLVTRAYYLHKKRTAIGLFKNLYHFGKIVRHY
jgi:hypothetical protein